MKVTDRARFTSLAEAEGLPVEMPFVTAPHDVRRNRVTSRNESKTETFSFEVTPAMVDFMEKQFEPPTDSELSKANVFNSA